jgi:hypothetical protein
LGRHTDYKRTVLKLAESKETKEQEEVKNHLTESKSVAFVTQVKQAARFNNLVLEVPKTITQIGEEYELFTLNIGEKKYLIYRQLKMV